MTEEALECALSALRHRDRSAYEIERRLAERGFPEVERERVLETLRRTGLVDDSRFAQARAASLAERGSGNALIRHALVDAGIDRDEVDEAIARLEPEAERARRIASARGGGQRAARYLQGRGFAYDAVMSAVAVDGEDALR